MSFRCGSCGKIACDGERPTRLVVKKREKTYQNKIESGMGKFHKVREFVTKGWEIVKEIGVCKTCAEVRVG